MSEKELDKDQASLLQKAFDAFDTDKKGWIATGMVATILDMLGQALPQHAVDAIISEIDTTGSGQMDFEMFCILASKFIGEKQENEVVMHKELMEAFRFYDKEGNGYITIDVLREILLELDPNLSAEELNGMIEEIDSDGSGTIDFDEFKAMMTGD